MKRAVRGALSVVAVITVVSFSPAPALAQPPASPPEPTTASEALKQYRALNDQAEKVNEDLLAAKNDLKNKQSELDKANRDLVAAKKVKAQALKQEEAFRGQVDILASASFQGARFNKLSALLTGASAQDFLDRASALSVLASDNKEALDKYTGAVNQAADAESKSTDAQRRATDAKKAAQALVSKINKSKQDLAKKISDVRDAYNELSGADRDALGGPVDNGVYLAPPGAAGVAMETALAQRGDPYVWGASGPNSFDCSGLVLFAYKAAGVSLPHSSRAQYGYGKSVAYGEWRPGDLLFYGGSASSIHHVAMYVGNGMIVHASTSGVPVKTATAVPGGGRDYFGAKRIVG